MQWRSNFQSDSRVLKKVLWTFSIILLATRVLTASPNFGLEKHGQKGPSATFCQKKTLIPIISPFLTHHNISLPFQVATRTVNNFIHFLSTCCGLNFVRILLANCKLHMHMDLLNVWDLVICLVRPSKLAELSRSEFDPELFSHSEYGTFLWPSRQKCRI